MVIPGPHRQRVKPPQLARPGQEDPQAPGLHAGVRRLAPLANGGAELGVLPTGVLLTGVLLEAVPVAGELLAPLDVVLVGRGGPGRVGRACRRCPG